MNKRTAIKQFKTKTPKAWRAFALLIAIHHFDGERHVDEFLIRLRKKKLLTVDITKLADDLADERGEVVPAAEPYVAAAHSMLCEISVELAHKLERLELDEYNVERRRRMIDACMRTLA